MILACKRYRLSTVDAVCMTNMDSLAPSISRPSVGILPTSTSVGCRCRIVVGSIRSMPSRGKKLLVWNAGISILLRASSRAKQPETADFTFKNMDPGASAQAMQLKDANISSIMVWNPFVMSTLRARTDSKVLFDSSAIPEEIIDMVVVSKDSLAKKGGKNFAYAIIETYYEINKLMADPKTSDQTLTAIGAKV